MYAAPSVPYRKSLSVGTMLGAVCRRVAVAGTLGLFGPWTGVHAQSTVGYAEGIVNQQMEEGYFWIHQNEDTHALHAIERALQIQPDNVEAQLMLGAVQVHQGDSTAARATLRRLEAVHGPPRQLAALQQWLTQPPVDKAALGRVRTLADHGNVTQAMAGYRALFPQPILPPALEVEYDSVQAGTPSGYGGAQQRLQALLDILPHDLEAQLALDKAMSYQPATRSQALDRIRKLVDASDTPSVIRDEAIRMWRGTLGWMGTDPQAVPYYQAWLRFRPDDTEIRQRLDQASHMQLVQAGFAALASNDLDQAESDFNHAMAGQSPNAAAIEGLGLVAQRRGDMDTARTLLTQASALAPDNADLRKALAGLDAPGADPLVARMWALVSHHDYEQAWSLLSRIESRHGMIADTAQARAIMLEARHDYARAAVAWYDLLRLAPGNVVAEAGLARIALRAGRLDEATQWIARLRAAHYPGLPALDAQLLQARALATSDPRLRATLLEQALRQLPDNGWDHLHLAQALIALGQPERARTLMATFCNAAHGRTDALQACFLFALQEHDMPHAADLLAGLPHGALTPDMARGAALVALWQRIEALPADDAQAVGVLRTLPITPDPDGARGEMVMTAMVRRHAPAAVMAQVLGQAAAASTMAADQALAYAGLFMQLGDIAGAQRMIDWLDGHASLLAPQQRAARQRMEESLIIAQADRDDLDGHPDRARQLVDPLLAQDPDSVALLLARGRIAASSHDLSGAIGFDTKALHLQPDDELAQAAMARHGLAMGHERAARDMADTLMARHPQWGDTWEIRAELDGRVGHDRARLHDLIQARRLDCTPPEGTHEPAPQPDPGCAPQRLRADDERPDINTSFVFGAGAPMPETYSYNPRLTPVESLNAQRNYLSRALVPQADGNIEIRDRSGQSGLGHLTAINIPMTATIPLSSTRQSVSFSIMPSVLMSGNPLAQGQTARQYGTVAGNGVRPGFHVPGAVGGVALGVHYRRDWIAADVGSTPLGFVTSTVLGGVELTPRLTNTISLRLTGERRVVNDSLLSFAGARDPGTGRVWGGVTRNRGHGQLEWGTAKYNAYAGGGYAVMKGVNTVANHESEAGAGGSAQVWHGRETQHLRIGLDLVYFGYKRNTYFFTWGQGGYFSPHAFMAALVPVTYDGHAGRWTWLFKGEAGYQHYTQNATGMFPLGGGGTYGRQSYAGQSTGGLAGNVMARMIYQMTPTLRMGLEGGYSRSGSWDEAHGMFMIHYAPAQ
ncbi:cellulose synthase operon protein C [Komagataeibacter diospyri]|uniref:cellulose synthase subunit BcsC-related outer membrane protein n=1 Tax=Komagataeibacter diospyri TaxID=1932662 RepID=UPI0011352521|nr:cellulose synthase subunit BcsC-related outer membrane protein [Komagataeibacter diospyri]GCE90137.1 cellulose synthase operon protein C [Komagataeibacter diospyri]